MMSGNIWLSERRRHYDGYARPSRFRLILALLVLLAGLIWIDAYEVPFALRSLACDIHVTPWSGIFASPKFLVMLPVLSIELFVWGWIIVWIWPVRAIVRPRLSDWILVLTVFLVACAAYFFQVAALEPAPWHQCLTDERGVQPRMVR
jgi:hypothetical protein